ncbi:MAG: hypothetical protein WD646_14745 [Actinomycetota bacterium]
MRSPSKGAAVAQVAEDRIAITDGKIVGPLRRSVNQAQKIKGSIHNDAVASKLGFRGGTVAGSIHLELFPPVLLEAFGDRWFERGTLSINFRNPTTDREPVRAILKQPYLREAGAQVEAFIERDDGMLVGEGTASVGFPPEPTALEALDLNRFPPGELRILAGLQAGDVVESKEIECAASVQIDRLDVITEPLDWYSDSPWGGPVASPATIVQFLYTHPARVIGAKAENAVGLFGAIEVRHVNGPMVLDRTYRIGAEVLAVGESPKTEYVWFSSYADSLDGARVAEMRMQLRWMKASSQLYQ